MNSENAPQRGVVAFITNRKFLTGWPYAGLRKMMRERFDRIEIFDLRGDVRRGERAGVSADQGVFNIQVGTAITIGVADGSKANGEVADVFYNDSWAEGLFSRRAKLNQLAARAGAGTSPNAIAVARNLLDDMRPEPFQNGEFVNLKECFVFYRSGLQTKRDPLVYDPLLARLSDRIRLFLSSSERDATQMFHNTRDRTSTSARAIPFDNTYISHVAYRPFDRRYLYNHRAYGDFLRPELQEVWGNNNVGLYAMPFGTGAGPAVWCHGLLPDYHAFRGSYGGYAFPLYDRRPRIDAPNLAPALVEGLSAAYGEAVAAEDVFDVLLCLLSAVSYTLRFGEDIEDTFPHVAFPARHAVFLDAVRIGREIRAVETFARAPAEARADFVRVETQPRGEVAQVDLTGELLTLCADRSGRITGLPQAVWNFSVSGYRVLSRWLEARVGLPADLGFVRELRDICGRIAELIELFGQADIVLNATLREPLSCEALGLAPPQPEENDRSD